MKLKVKLNEAVSDEEYIHDQILFGNLYKLAANWILGEQPCRTIVDEFIQNRLNIY